MDYELILPPYWHKKDDNSGYFNELTLEHSDSNPINKYFAARHKYFQTDENNNKDNTIVGLENTANTSPTEKDTDQLEDDVVSNVSYSVQDDDINNTMTANQIVCKGKCYDYRCQWSERDVFGKSSIFGVTIRFYEDNNTQIKFDGIDGEWVFSSLQGAYGPIMHHDLYIGAKVVVFGRHLTISSANGAAIRWSEKEVRRLEKQQDSFRAKILSVGHNPCVRKKDADTIKHITRDQRSAANVDLRKMLIDSARLGEQLAHLGLSVQL